jgi:hypothetical protein
MNLRERYWRLTFWNKLAVWGSVASILGILLTAVIPMLSVTSLVARANIEATFFPISAVFGKVLPHLSADGSFAPLQIQMSLKNSGGARATGAVVSMSFRPHLDAQVIHGSWRSGPRQMGYRYFFFDDPQVPLYTG